MSTIPWPPGRSPRGPVPGAGGRLVRTLLGRRGPVGPAGQAARSPGVPELRAVLWDMDGLLIDSEPLWTVAEIELAAMFGSRWSESIKAQCIGKRLDAAVPLMLAGFGVPVEPASLAVAGEFLLRRMPELFNEQLPVLPGARGLLSACDAAGIACALVSSSYRTLVDACLGALGEHPFMVSIAGDEVSEAKPSPQPYLLAAAALGLDPADCVVLEDSVTGATAGVAAGCTTVLVPGETVPLPPEDLGWTRARSLTELTPAELRQRMATPRA